MDGADKYQHDNHVYFEKKVYRGDLSKSQRESIKCFDFFFCLLEKRIATIIT